MRGARVAWQSDSSVSAVIAALAVLRLGGVLVPLSAAQSERERATVLDDVMPVLLIAPPERTVEQGEVPAYGAESLQGPQTSEPLAPVALDPTETALIIYTSGTTGSPKGAVLTHGNLAAGASSLIEAWRIGDDDRLVTALPLFHVHGLVVALMTVLAAGAGVDLLPRFDVETFLGAIEQKGSTLSFCVPTMLHRLAQHGDLDGLRRLRLLVSGSAPLSTDLFDTIRSKAGMTILERYGMTETLLTLSNPLDGERRSGTVGLPLPGVTVDLPEPMGGEAELRVSGPTVFAGYWNRPEATAEVLESGWMSTGDLVRVDRDGYVVICGRSRDLIISGGYNVYPAEIEDVIRGRHGIVDVAVVGRPSDEWGEEVVAFVVTEGGRRIEPSSMREELATELSTYKIPRAFITVDELPRNALGKLQRHLLS